jgi:hypothetical protein
MKLCEVKFNGLRKQGYIGLTIFENDLIIAEGFMGEVLKAIPHLANRNIITQRPYFNEWVVEIEGENDNRVSSSVYQRQ